MTKQAEAHADEDAKKKELIETRNAADSLIFTAEKSLKDMGDKVKPEDKTEIEEKIKVLREKLTGDNKEEIETSTRELSDSLQKVGAQMYENQGAQGGQGNPQAEEAQASEENGEQKKDDKKDAEEGEVVDN